MVKTYDPLTFLEISRAVLSQIVRHNHLVDAHINGPMRSALGEPSLALIWEPVNGTGKSISVSVLRRVPMTLTKEALIQNICWATELRKCEAAKTVESLLEIVKGTLASGEDVLITGFGKFCVKDKRKRRGRNPDTGEDLILTERRVVTFKSSTVLKRKLNGGQG